MVTLTVVVGAIGLSSCANSNGDSPSSTAIPLVKTVPFGGIQLSVPQDFAVDPVSGCLLQAGEVQFGKPTTRAPDQPCPYQPGNYTWMDSYTGPPPPTGVIFSTAQYTDEQNGYGWSRTTTINGLEANERESGPNSDCNSRGVCVTTSYLYVRLPKANVGMVFESSGSLALARRILSTVKAVPS
jgi:hypothetical protein